MRSPRPLPLGAPPLLARPNNLFLAGGGRLFRYYVCGDKWCPGDLEGRQRASWSSAAALTVVEMLLLKVCAFAFRPWRDVAFQVRCHRLEGSPTARRYPLIADANRA